MSATFKVVYSEFVFEQLHKLARLANGEGRRLEFQDSISKIMKAMRLVPNDLGESRECYSKMRVQGRIYFLGSLTVEFGVHLDLPIVYVRKFKWRQKR